MLPLIQKVIAQSMPTFPYDGPFEEPDQPDTQKKAVIKLTNASTKIEAGSTTKADVTIESESQEVSSYTITIMYDPEVLEVVDKSSSQAGIQVEFLDSFALEKTNTADNSEGKIKIIAEITGSAQTVNRRVAAIIFRGKSVGTSVVSVNKSQSSIKNQSNQDILGSTTSLNLTVTGESAQTTTTTTTTTTTISPTSTTIPGTSPTTTVPGELPESGIGDIAIIISLVLTGILMSLIGLRSFLDKKIRKIL